MLIICIHLWEQRVLSQCVRIDLLGKRQMGQLAWNYVPMYINYISYHIIVFSIVLVSEEINEIIHWWKVCPNNWFMNLNWLSCLSFHNNDWTCVEILCNQNNKVNEASDHSILLLWTFSVNVIMNGFYRNWVLCNSEQIFHFSTMCDNNTDFIHLYKIYSFSLNLHFVFFS